MQSLKGSAILAFSCLLSWGCQTPVPFSINTHRAPTDILHTIKVRPGRVLQKCIYLHAEAENRWRHQYFMYVLTDQNEVLEIMHATNQDRTTCNSQTQKINRVLQTKQLVKICVRDELKERTLTTEIPDKIINFSNLGSHKVAYNTLTFDSICNNRRCFSSNEAWVNSCPGFTKQ